MGTESTYHHGDLRAALVRAALEMLEAGEPFSLRGVARAVGVSQAAPYRHFPDRDHLESAVAVEGFSDMARLMNEALAAGGEPLDLAVIYVDYALDHPALFHLMFGEPCDDGDPERVAAVARLTEVIDSAAARAAGAEGADGLTKPVALAAWALAHGLAMLHLDDKLDATDREAVRQRVRDSYRALISI